MAAGRWRRPAGVLVVAAAAAGLGWVVADRWSRAGSLHIRWRWPWLVAALGCALVADALMSGAWAWLVARSGDRSSLAVRTRVFWVGQLARFLPTGLGSLPARVVVGGRAGLSRRLVAGTTVAELLASAATAGVAALLAVPPPAGPAVAGAALVVAAAGFGWSVRVAAPRLASGPEGAAPRVPTAVGARFVAAQQAKVLIRAAGVWSLLHLVTSAGPGFAPVAGATGLGYLAGLLAVIAPGGIGVREATIVAVLAASGAGVAGAAAAATAWRLVETVVEPPLVGAAVLWARTGRHPGAVTASPPPGSADGTRTGAGG